MSNAILCGGRDSSLPGTEASFLAKDELKIGDIVYTIKGDINDELRITPSGKINAIAFSPDGTKLVLGGQFSGTTKLYSVSGTTLTFLSNIYADTARTLPLNGILSTLVFSPDGTKLVLGGSFIGYAKIYSVSGTSVTFVSNIYADAGTTALSSTVKTAVFSPDGTKLVLGGQFSGYAKIYSVSGTTVTFVSNIYADAGTNALNSNVYTAAFSPDGTKLVLGGVFAGLAKIYIVSGTMLIFVSNIYADTGTTALNSSVTTSSFSPDGTKLVLGGQFTGCAKIYTVSGTTVTFVSNIYADAGTNALIVSVQTASFSPNGTKLVLGGQFTGFAKIYTVSGTTVTYVSDIYTDIGTNPLTNVVMSSSFSPDGTKLIIGGTFFGNAKIYSVSGNTVMYVSDIYGDNGTTKLSSSVTTSVFSPDGTTLVLGGTFIGKAKIYSVSGTVVSFVSNIYADAGTTLLGSDISRISFSPDGTKLVVAGFFMGWAKIYSVSGTTVTYLSDIYADPGTTALSSAVHCTAFSPDGTTLVVSGAFTGYAKIYSVSGNTITFVRNIYADAGTTDFNTTVLWVSFSPDGTKLVLGGGFTGYAKIYSVYGTTVTFVSNIYADTGTTALSGSAYTMTFSPDGTKLVLTGTFTGVAKIYSVYGTTVTFVSNIYADNIATVLTNYINGVAFSPDSAKLVLSGAFLGSAKLYTVAGTTVTYVSDIYADDGTTALGGLGGAAAFSPDGTTLVVGGTFAGNAKIYDITGTTIISYNNIYIDTAVNPWDGVNVAKFSPDGTKLVLGGVYTGKAKIYSVSGTTLTFVSSIYADTGTTLLNADVTEATFSPDGTKLVLCGGMFAGFAKIYSVSGTTVTFVSNIYADAGTTALDSGVRSIIFSPDGTKLVLCGMFAGFAKIYSVSGTTVTFVRDMYMDNGVTPFNDGVYTATFSPDGTKLILGGRFIAKIYSISGTTVTFVSDMYMDNGTTIFDDEVYDATFSPDGTKLVLCGMFASKAKIYSVSGTTVTFVRDIYADAGTTALNSTAYCAAFSPDGTKLVLCGMFAGFAKIYSVSGTTVTFVRDMYMDNGVTPFNDGVYTATFSPDGTNLVMGGFFTGFAKIYSVSKPAVSYIMNAYKYGFSMDKMFKRLRYCDINIGLVMENISKGKYGRIKVLTKLQDNTI